MAEAKTPVTVPVEELRPSFDPAALPFDSSADCPACDGIIGQDRALRALQTGLDIKNLGYNIFITGMVGTGRTTSIKQLLERLKKGDPPPDDLLYVNNFRNADEPWLIQLPAGQGRSFVEAMNDLISRLQHSIPDWLKSPYYTEHRDAIIESQQARQKEILKAFEEETAKEGFSVIQVQMGLFVKPDLIPVIDDQPVPFPKLEQAAREKKFDEKTLSTLKTKYADLSKKLEAIFEELREIDDKTRLDLKSFDKESITPVIAAAVDEIRTRFPQPKVAEYLDEVEAGLIGNIDLFKSDPKKEEEKRGELAVDPFLEYRVNLLIDNTGLDHAPVVIETNPSYVNLFGSIDSSISRFGSWLTDFTKIKAGSFLKANGGFLVLNALDALIESGVWPTLKRTLRNQTLEIQNFASLFLLSMKTLKPEPIKVNVKVVMIGDEEIYNILFFQDEEFKRIFKIKSEFDTEMPRSDDAVQDYVRFIRKISDEGGLLPFDRTGMAAVIEHGIRLSGRREKLSTLFHRLADVIREADYWARKDGQETVQGVHVEQAVRERFERINLVERKIQEMIAEGTILIETSGGVVGQVNGLAVYSMGQAAFGKPSRITARTSVGRAGVINIEREADLSGQTHNKGVLILGGYLRGKYAVDRPFALSASIAFEQSYGGIDGDSASSTEVYAILSALSGLPLRQDIAVTGSLNQKGEIQPIGGVNEKIEGFFDVCRAQGLTGTQGVMIPVQNVRNLMLRRDVVAAAAEGRFHIYPVRTIDEGIEILTGVPAGRKNETGTWEERTVNFLVDRELERLARASKGFFEERNKEKP
ncbi:MAG TPA: ATP-binding protein [Candidatus Aminicenantes bacterium]|nr:ATP-binding protein [Candidatus Aminicenantes bacterium]